MATANAQNEEVQRLQEKVIELEEAVKRGLADYRNLERQTREERVRLREQACQDVLIDLLPTLDHLNRAVDHQPDSVLGMILAELQRVLSSHGLERIWARNKPFDHETMEALGTAPGKENTVVREEQAGYSLNGAVLRPARVIVGTGEKAKEQKE